MQLEGIIQINYTNDGQFTSDTFRKCCNSSSVISEMIWMWFRNLSACAAMAVDLNLRWTSSSRVRLAAFAASRDGAKLNSLPCNNVEWAVDPVTQHEKFVCEYMKVHNKKTCSLKAPRSFCFVNARGSSRWSGGQQCSERQHSGSSRAQIEILTESGCLRGTARRHPDGLRTEYNTQSFSGC